jgi:IS5 family transposase
MNKKWNTNIRTKKGYLKIHVAIDIRSKKILSMQVTDEHVHDGKVLPTLVDDLVKSNGIIIDKLLADGAYDSNNNFRCLSENGITPCIKLRRDARIRKTSHNLRNLSVISQRHNLQRRKDSVSYGHRWMVETVFSSIKRMFGEYVYSAKIKNMKQELLLKASLYNKFMSI